MKRKTVLVTGTSSGIGKITAQYFEQHGWNFAATVRKKEDFFFNEDNVVAKNFLPEVSNEDQCCLILESNAVA